MELFTELLVQTFWVYGPCVWFQKVSLWIKRWRRISLGVFVMASLSMIMSFACLLKSWFFSWKCLDANMVLEWGIFPSFSWLHSLILKAVSAYPKHCDLHRAGAIIFVKKLVCFLNLLTLGSWCCCNLVTAKFLLFQKHGNYFPGLKVLLFIFFTMSFSILLLPMSFLRYLLRLKAADGLFWKFFSGIC